MPRHSRQLWCPEPEGLMPDAQFGKRARELTVRGA
jgi:hypothetical protein